MTHTPPILKLTKVLVPMLAVLAAGCASAPPATDNLAVAKSSVASAEQAGAVQSAPTELSNARDKLATAEKASDARNAKLAARMADQANVDARFAEAKAAADRSHKAAAELDASLQALKQESMRSTSSTQ